VIADLKPYPAMKDAGVPSLGEVPEHWGVRRLRTVTDMRVSNIDKHSNDDERTVRLCNYLDVYKHDHIGTDMPFMRATASTSEIARFRLAVGDVLITKDSESWNDIGVPALVLESADDLICGYHLALLRSDPELLTGAYLFRAVQSEGVAYQLHINANGVTRFGLSHSAIKSTWVPTPPLYDQAAIVRFLDYADGRIRRYIRAKQQLIKLLEEEKRAILHRAVTRGLDPNVRLKPSGVEWLGDVPEHWEVRRVKSLSLVKRGASPRPIADPRYFDDAGVYAWVRIADVTASSRYLERTTQRLSSLGQSLSVPLEPGALFLSIAGSVGKPMITRIKCCIHDGFVYFPQFHGNVEYLCRVFSSGTPFARLGKLGTQLNLNTETVGSIFLGWPPADEQAAIVSFLDEATATRDPAIRSAQREISLLLEYRSRLIADVVTGKLDVREAVAGLPEELEQIDEAELEEVVDDELADDLDTELEEVEA